MVRDGRLGDVAAGCEVAGADLPVRAELAQDGQPGRVGGGLEKQDVRVCLAPHDRIISTRMDIDKYQ
jgi:hypothetical protein